jgi:nicotinamidase-related amidase
VRKTCFDLLKRGYDVYILSDAVGSIQNREKEVALEGMRDAGAHLTTTSMVQSELDNEYKVIL